MLKLSMGQTTQPPIIDVWTALNELCLTNLTKEQCAGLIGTNPLYFPPTCKQEWTIPKWAYIVAGFIAGRYI